MLYFRDYCRPHSELWNILKNENELNSTSEEVPDLNYTLNQSHSTRPYDTFIIYALKLQEENMKNLNQIALNHKIRIAPLFWYVIKAF